MSPESVCVRVCVCVCVRLSVCTLEAKPLISNIFRTSSKVKVKGQGHQGKKNVNIPVFSLVHEKMWSKVKVKGRRSRSNVIKVKVKGSRSTSQGQGQSCLGSFLLHRLCLLAWHKGSYYNCTECNSTLIICVPTKDNPLLFTEIFISSERRS